MNSASTLVHATGCILLVDDNVDNRELMRIIFESEGFRILSAASGQEALSIVARQPPDVVLLDLMMPDMDGYEVARAIKASAATRHIRIIMLSGLDDQRTRTLALSAGADAFHSKPVNLAALRGLVTELLPAGSVGSHVARPCPVPVLH